MRIRNIIPVMAASVVLLAGCATTPQVSVEVQVQNCMNNFLNYAAINFPDDPRMNPENADQFDEFINELQTKCENDQKADPEGFYNNYSVESNPAPVATNE